MISSVGTVNYQQSGHQIILVSTSTHPGTSTKSRSNSGSYESRNTADAAQQNHGNRSIESLSSATLTTPTPANSADSNLSTHTVNSSLISVDGGSTSTSASTALQPRLHPKKRKFNPAELEEMEPTTSNGNASGTIISSMGEQNAGGYEKGAGSDSDPASWRNGAVGQSFPAPDVKPIGAATNERGEQRDLSGQTMNQSPGTLVIKEENGSHVSAIAAHSSFGANSRFDGRTPETTTESMSAEHQKVYNYSKFQRSGGPPTAYLVERPPGQQQQQHGSTGVTITPTASPLPMEYTPAPASASNEECLDLSEFCNCRVLAKHHDFYVTGVIRSVGPSNAILVELDHPEGTRQMYYDILGNGKYDVVSDASPSVNDVSAREESQCRTHSGHFYF